MCNKINQNAELKKIISKKARCELKNVSIDMFKNEKGFGALYQLKHMTPSERINPNNEKAAKLLKTLKDNLEANHPFTKNILEEIKTAEKDSAFFKQFHVAKGGVEISSIAGSVIGLTVLAPEISHLILHPIMKICGLEKNNEKKEKQLDTKA